MPVRARPLLAVLATVVATGALGACGSSDDSSSSTSSSSASSSGKEKTYTVGIDVAFHPIWDYVKAKSGDYFKGKPYKVDFKILDATTQVPAFGKGSLDVFTTPPSFIPRVKEQYGIDTAMFFPLARWSIGPQILTKCDGPYKTLESLQGKTVAVPPLKTRFGAEEASILAATDQNIRSYFKLQETDAAAQQLTLGRVDAAFIEAPTTYPLLKTKKFCAVYSVHDAFQKAFGDPAVVNGGYIARKDFISENKGFVDDLVAATQDAWDKYNSDPAEVNEAASKVSGVPVEQLEVVGQVLNLEGTPKSKRRITQQDVASWTKIWPLLQQSGFYKKAPSDPASAFVVGAGA